MRFTASPNALFEARVAATAMLSPSFVRLTVTGPQLALFAAHGRDQRIKILVPHDGYPVELDPGPEPLPEAEWRTLWRTLAAGRRPVLRSYTVSAARPERQEVDLDVFLHTRPGPASAWATSARVGERVLLSGPDVRRGRPTHGIQWRPGTATSVLLAGDETAIPAMRGILASLGPGIRGQLLAEVADPADAARLAIAQARVTVAVCVRGVSTLQGAALQGAALQGAALQGAALQGAAEAWSQVHGEQAARHGEAFYAWVATESTRAARIRAALTDAGIAPDRIHTQGYWNDRNRARAPKPVAARG